MTTSDTLTLILRRLALQPYSREQLYDWLQEFYPTERGAIGAAMCRARQRGLVRPYHGIRLYELSEQGRRFVGAPCCPHCGGRL